MTSVCSRGELRTTEHFWRSDAERARDAHCVDHVGGEAARSRDVITPLRQFRGERSEFLDHIHHAGEARAASIQL